MSPTDLKKLLNSLTLPEKVGQLVQLSGEFFDTTQNIVTGPVQKLGLNPEMVPLVGSVLNVVGAEKTRKIQQAYLENSSHKIPLLFMADIVYGLKTVYPIPLGMGATWDPNLIRTAYQNTASEAYASGAHVSFAPMVDIVRDARWGRSLESTGEDPVLNASMAAAMVEGFQHNLGKDSGIAACVKHFAAYGAAESGREYNSVDMSEMKLFQDYLPPYKAAVDAGTEMVMTSFNTINGVPVTASSYLLHNVLREKWGFEGIIISDYAAVNELIAHGYSSNQSEAAKDAFVAGVDIDMQSSAYANNLDSIITDGQVDESKLNAAVLKVLQLKNKLGLFEDPYRGADKQVESNAILSSEKRELAREVSNKAMVLLKNEKNILPLDTSKKIALIGPYSDEQELLGLWAVHADRNETVTIADAFREVVPSDRLLVRKGTNITDDVEMLRGLGLSDDVISKNILNKKQAKMEFDSAIEIANKSNVVIFAAGEHTFESGEGGSKTNITLPENQKKLIKAIRKLGKKIILVTINGRPLVLTDIIDDVDAVIVAWFPGTEGGHAIADTIFGKTNPSGRLSMTFPYSVGQLPIYYSRLTTGRPETKSTHSSRFTSRYIDSTNDPLFPFGFGLSYSQFNYTDMKLSGDVLHEGEKLTVSVVVSNQSDRDGIETVQMYIQDLFAKVVQPEKRLKSFKKVLVPARSEVTVSFDIDVEMLKYFDNQLHYNFDPGDFKVYVGHDSLHLAEARFVLRA
ncbi:beta-glucosidase BglX [Leuconostoc pseudomesenteroides]|uniref:beta-glucosidase BglX n=3 Tax=Leuconostoc pseudomesenteroides TaxID=33968 RepID=UPI00301D4BCD